MQVSGIIFTYNQSINKTSYIPNKQEQTMNVLKETYQSPDMETIDIAAEQGYATSWTTTGFDEENGTW